MAEVMVTVLPPGRAEGAGDLNEWASRRMIGKSGVYQNKKKNTLRAWKKTDEEAGRQDQAPLRRRAMEIEVEPKARMSSDHLAAWRENIAERAKFLSVEPATLVKLIDEVLEARAVAAQ